MRVKYGIDSMDWSSGHDDRDKCVEALGTWFENLSFKTQLAIHYAQQMQQILSTSSTGTIFALGYQWFGRPKIE